MTTTTVPGTSMNPDGVDVRAALVRQWGLIADVVDEIDLAVSSRCTGWTNREVLAHLHLQPRLVVRFLGTEGAGAPVLGLTENLSGTKAYRELIDASAREGAASNKVELRGPLEAAGPIVLTAHLEGTITTVQDPISVNDYLITRCIEAVVHGNDLVPPVAPDPVAQAITSRALLEALAVSAPTLVPHARALPIDQWIALATGRTKTTGPLAGVLPVMS